MSKRNTGGTSDSIVFHGCSATSNAPGAPQAGGQRRQTVIKGKRVRTIDIHAHAIIPKSFALLGNDIAKFQFPDMDEMGPKRIAAMDRQGIDIEVISVNPFWYDGARDLAAEVCKINNETLTEWCARHPDRFMGFASVTLQDPKLAVEQLEHAVKKLGMKGPAVGASCGGVDFSDAKFHPFWAKCEELGVLVFIHPQSTPQLNERFKGNGWLANTIGNPLDTTICLSKLIFEGTLDKFPNLKLCSAHGGGYLPSYAPRSDHPCRVAPWHCNPEIKLKKKPTEYLKMMYYDTLVFTSEMLRHLAAEVGSDRLVIGTDHPIPWHEDPVTHIMNAPGFSDEERIAMLGGTAAKLLGIKD
jgi:aminocarboxymuconate-semialdehyde decarboxylase